MAKKEFGQYYIGLDMGTNSIGWAVTDESYHIQKLNGKALWGVRLFDKASTAANTRVNRIARRRIARQTWRLSLLQELLAPEISKVDPGFYLRLKESNLQLEDKSVDNRVKYSLFTKDYMSDRAYYSKYPTIYHLRKAMLEDVPEAFDVRLLYLVLSHFFKHRGHFLFEGLDAGSVSDFAGLYPELERYIQENLEGMEEWHCTDTKRFEKIIATTMQGVTEKRKQLKDIFQPANKQSLAMATFLSGGRGALADLFAREELKDAEKGKFSFKDDFDALAGDLEALLGEDFELVAKLKAIYDWGLLQDILQGASYLALAKVKVYQEHQRDLAVLKNYCRQNRKLYRLIFGSEATDNYSHYIGSCLDRRGRKAVLEKRCDQAAFCGFLKKALKDVMGQAKTAEQKGDDFQQLLYRISIERAFPKQTVKSNGIIPMQVNKAELEKILANAQKHLPFLAVQDATGFSVAEKLVQIFCFRIPYYVGPLAGTELSKAKKRCWVVRTEDKIYPWNFDQVVDKEKSAEEFITNMTNKCTYLPSKNVLPKYSLLYAEFMARNELNNLRYDGKKLDIDIINAIYDALLLKGKGKLTKKKIADFLRSENFFPEAKPELISGVDNPLQANLQAYKDFSAIFGEHFVKANPTIIEDIILWLTLFSEEKQMLRRQVGKHYGTVPELTAEALNKVCKLKYQGWGRLSRTFLSSDRISYLEKKTGELLPLIVAFRTYNSNLMQFLTNERVQEDIASFNGASKNLAGGVRYENVDELYLSPAVKRSTWQAILIVQELEKVMGHQPKRIFIEMTRSDGEKVRTVSRKAALSKLYESCQKEEPELYAKLQGETEESLRSNKLFLYYTQLGRCMYSGEKIDINSLYSKEGGVDLYDRDHIYPRSKTKDDSLDNLVLVKYIYNREKTDTYPLEPSIQAKMKAFWQSLMTKGLISQKKYNRLVRIDPLTEEELAQFINRQIVETSQSTKAAAELLQLECPDSEIVYSKAGNVSDFRQEFELLKCRDVNDYHHAKDAYLNIVVGNAYHVKFTKDALKFVKGLHSGQRYTLKTKEFYDRDIVRGGEVAWKAGPQGSMAVVRKTMAKNNILYTRMALTGKGQLYDIQLMKKGKGQIPVKADRDIAKYGGYNKASTAYLMLVKSVGKKGKELRTLEAVPIYLAKKVGEDEVERREFLTGSVASGGCGLTEPVVLLPKIRLNSLVAIDGCLMYVKGKTGNKITGVLGVQLVLSYDEEIYIKKLCKFLDRMKTNKDLKVNKWDGISAVENLSLYDALLAKHKNTVYRTRPSSQLNTLQSGRTKFIALSTEEQCQVLGNILELFNAKTPVANLAAIGGSANAGSVKFIKEISAKNTAILFNQSVTGIFEEAVDMLKI